MKKGALIAIAATAIAATGIGTVTALKRPALTPIPSDVTTTSTSADTSADSTVAIAATDLTTPSEQVQDDTTATTAMPTATQNELRNFPHQPLQLTDEVPAGSDFDQFRQRFRQALRDRNEDFILPLLPKTDDQTIAYGFGMLDISESGLDQPHSWFWSVLDKAMLPGCVDQPAADYGVAAGGDAVVWVCSGITQAFEEQLPPPADADGIDHYVEHVIVLGENVNVRDRPSMAGEVIALLSNEVVGSYDDGWPIVHESQGDDAPYDPIDSWTPVTVPNGKTGFVYSRYAYFPLDTRLVFGKENDQWRVLMMPAGD